MFIDDYVIGNLFHKIKTEDGTVLWRSVAGGDNGYIVIYEDGVHNHTYHYPPNFIDALDT